MIRRLNGLSLLLLLCFISFLSAIQAPAQITNVTGDQAPPIGGAGHDYIKELNETVNPSTGSVSIRISVPVARSRGFSVPFAFGYDSNGAFHRAPGFTGAWQDNTSYLGMGGWSYLVPKLGGLMQEVMYVNPSGAPYQCYYMIDFTLVDLDGATHALPIAPNQLANTGNCVYSNVGNPWHPASFYLFGADANYQATTVQMIGAGNVPPPVTVTNRNGLVYSFPQLSEAKPELLRRPTSRNRRPKWKSGNVYGLRQR